MAYFIFFSSRESTINYTGHLQNSVISAPSYDCCITESMITVDFFPSDDRGLAED